MDMGANWDAAELAREADHEAIMREMVFAKRVAAGTMRIDDARRRIAMMREIARRLRAAADEPQGRLF